jgi:hypothetical protein
VTTSLSATDESISFYEAGQYQFVIKGQNCTASVGRYRSFSLVQRAGTPEQVPVASAQPEVLEPAAPPPAKTARANPCAEVGPPTRLEVRPARKLLRPGESFDFRAVVLDAKGCPVRRGPAWAVTSTDAKVTVTPVGNVTVAEDAPEGDVEITASIGGRSAAVTVEVASKERYEALLKSGGFNESGEASQAASVAIASNTIGAKSAVAEDRATGRKVMFVGIVGAVALLLGLVGLVMVRRTRRATARGVAPSGVVPRGVPTLTLPPPTQLGAPPAEPPPAEAALPSKRICPVCGKHYPAESRFCGTDGASLVPIN